MNEKVKFSSKVIIWCIILSFIAFCTSLILSENNPERPSFHKAEVESDEINFPIRQSLGLFVVTAYCPGECCCGEFADGITASGHIIQLGDKFCAADPMIPFGKHLDIPGYGYVPIWDRGGKIKGNKLDVFFPTHEEALEWGKQELEIHCWVEEGE